MLKIKKSKSVKIVSLQGRVSNRLVRFLSLELLGRDRWEGLFWGRGWLRLLLALLVDTLPMVVHDPLQGGSPAPETDIAVEQGQVDQGHHQEHCQHGQGQGHPLPRVSGGQEDPEGLSQGKQQKEDEGEDDAIENMVVLFADAIIDELAVMIELFHATVAAFAVIAIGVNHDFASFAPFEGVSVLVEGAAQQSGVYRVRQHQLAVVVADKEENEEVEAEEEHQHRMVDVYDQRNDIGMEHQDEENQHQPQNLNP